jgi:hypothetical protein
MPMNSKTASRRGGTIATIRGILLTILVLGMLGTGAELLLIKHTEDPKQWIPLLLISASFFVLIWHAAQRRRLSLRFFQAVMVAFIAAGVAGFYFHYRGSVEFKLESKPSLKGWALFWEAMGSKAPPPLAPGVMIQLGLIGLAYAYRHPVLTGSKNNESKNEGE